MSKEKSFQNFASLTVQKFKLRFLPVMQASFCFTFPRDLKKRLFYSCLQQDFYAPEARWRASY